jgi:protein-S-isoprenylcysteine O-methyltransferase Ste14
LHTHSSANEATGRLWYAVVGSFRAVESTPIGGLLLGNLWPAYVFALPLGVRTWVLLHTWDDRSLQGQAAVLQEVVTVVFLAQVVALFVVRHRSPRGEHSTFLPGLVALLGTFILTLVAYLPLSSTTATSALLASSVLIILGTLWTIWSLTALGRCFGLFPEARGLVTSGPYRLVRHPVYLGEIISAAGLLLVKPNAVMVLIFVVFVGLQYWRAVFEERALSRVFPREYATYARRVPQLIPGWRPNF